MNGPAEPTMSIAGAEPLRCRPLGDALAQVGRVPEARSAILAALRTVEALLAGAGFDVREALNGPVAVALRRDVVELTIELEQAAITGRCAVQ